MGRGKTDLLSVEHRGRQGFESKGAPALHIGLDIFVDAKDLLDDDNRAPALALGLSMKGREAEPIMGAGQGDGLAHGGSSGRCSVRSV